MPKLTIGVTKVRPIIAETGPIGFGTDEPITPSMTLMTLKHQNFVDQANALNRGFTRWDIVGFTDEELNDHIQIALQDGFITEDGAGTGRYVTGQVAWRLKELTKGYVYERL